jgi:type IV secretion system protein TrbG
MIRSTSVLALALLAATALGAAAAEAPTPATALADSATLPGALPAPPPAPPTLLPPAPAAASAPEPDALAAARAFRESGRTPPVLEHSTELVVPYGHAQPVLRCAPLRVSAIQLQEGEILLSTSRGDTERFEVQASFSGRAGKTPLLVVKPLVCDPVATNLLVTTDRRIYSVTLESPGCKKGEGGELSYTRLLRFYYPEELVETLASQEELARRHAADETRNVIPLAPAASLTDLNFRYRWDRDARLPFDPPDNVFDDGAHVYIHFPPASRAHETPLLFILRDHGATEILNYAVRGDYFVTDRTFRRAVLVAGAQRAARLEIENQAPGAR